MMTCGRCERVRVRVRVRDELLLGGGERGGSCGYLCEMKWQRTFKREAIDEISGVDVERHQ